jgi:hypothetical protein
MWTDEIGDLYFTCQDLHDAGVTLGQHVLSVDSPPVVELFVSPLLTPIVTVIYSLSRREQCARC